KAPPIDELEKWYRRLDLVLDSFSTADLVTIKDAFRQEKLIFTNDSDWADSSAVFLTSDEDDAPGVPVIRASMRDMVLWGKIGVRDRPTPELLIQWLARLPSGH